MLKEIIRLNWFVLILGLRVLIVMLMLGDLEILGQNVTIVIDINVIVVKVLGLTKMV
jgi:hypothetical protein